MRAINAPLPVMRYVGGMTRPSLIAATAIFAVIAAAALAQGGPSVEIRGTMQQRVNPAMLAIWDIGNNAMDDEGALDSAQLDDAEWAELEARSRELAGAGSDMAATTNLIVAFPDNGAVGEGETSMAAVERQLRADPEGFRALAREFAEHAARIAAAARARDAAATGTLIGEMDAVCESCHSRYWVAE